MPSASQYADWIVEYCAKELGAPTDPMSLEKQLYYAQGFSLAVRACALFDDDFQAWKWGPVIKNVWTRYGHSGALITERHKPYFSFSSSELIKPDDETRDFISDVINFFGQLGSFGLSTATHVEQPWRDARGGLPADQPSSAVISKQFMQNYYAGLIEDGENALSRCALLSALPSPRWGWLYVAGICAREMVTHPFYAHGLALWGANSRLSERTPQPEYDRALFTPLTAKEAEDLEVFDSAEEFLASLKK